MKALHTAYAARSTAPVRARRDVLGWGASLPREIVTDLVIATNELITNGVKHGPAQGQVQLHITPLADGLLFVEVCDEGPARRVASRTPDATSGRGLHIVARLARDWGVSSFPTRTWFTLDVAGGPAEAKRPTVGTDRR